MHLWSMFKKTYYQNNQSRLILWKITTSTLQIGLPDVLVERRNHRQEKKDTMEELARSQPMEVKTIDNTRLSLLAIEVYERL
jgi:hypothetical protein